jgi:hypothetical protein
MRGGNYLRTPNFIEKMSQLEFPQLNLMEGGGEGTMATMKFSKLYLNLNYFIASILKLFSYFLANFEILIILCYFLSIKALNCIA